ncbi:hypothetical protein L873DRAFT_877270 [Choiromyces venosus 120613-1]|uniref:Uncharacterized protein n=1 Tax=Choiromyces venosus 120613-1 TaxID=1336337 RepID=A0A3N4K1G6_9PEZI|nr:hypothetical protein L873DRAFT_877270 [Choiromyces venosus 120613-1]
MSDKGPPPSFAQLIASQNRRQRGREGSVVNPFPRLPSRPPPGPPLSRMSIDLTPHLAPPPPPPPPPDFPPPYAESSSSSTSFSPHLPITTPPPHNIREDGYIYLQVEIGFDRMLPAPWAYRNEPASHFCLMPLPENLGTKYYLPGPHRHCHTYYASCDHRSFESFVMYNLSGAHKVVTSFMVLVPLLLETRPCRTLDLVDDAIKRAFPDRRNLENYNEINVCIGVEAASQRICTLRQMRRLFMALALFGERMVDVGAFTVIGPGAPVINAGYVVGNKWAEEWYKLLLELDRCYDLPSVLAFFQVGGRGAVTPLGCHWATSDSLRRSGTLNLISYTTFVQDIVIRATLERCVMFLWTAMHTPGEKFITWARRGISTEELIKFGCAPYATVCANDLEPNRGWKAESDALMEWAEEGEGQKEEWGEEMGESLPVGETEDEIGEHTGHGLDEAATPFTQDEELERAYASLSL